LSGLTQKFGAIWLVGGINLFVLDGRTGTVTVADPQGRRIAAIAMPRVIESRLGEPSSVAVDALGRVYLTGRRSGQVVRFW